MPSRRLAALALAALFAALPARPTAQALTPGQGAALAESHNGVMGGFTGAGGDPALGETVYKARCASCHDAPPEGGRTPPKATIANNTPTYIAQALIEGVMAAQARGLAPHDIASVAAYLSTRKNGGLDAGALEAPACTDKPAPVSLTAGPQWNGWGRDDAQSRYQPNPGLTAADVPRLKLKWAFAYAGSRNGQASVIGERLYVTSVSGAVYALNAKTGCAYWRFDIPGGSRTSPLVAKLPGKANRHAVYVTGWTERTTYALDADTGRLIWKTLTDNQSEVQMTGTPALHAGVLYVPVSSAEEAIATDDKYECCKFRGAVAALDAATGRKLWETFVAAEPRPFKTNPKGVQMYGPAGGAIWSAPSIDARRGVLYVATGDSYTDVAFANYDSIVAMDLKTGAIRWSKPLAKGDNYIIGCEGAAKRANCPTPAGPDYDFGATPILRTLKGGKQVLLAGQKSSQVYALDPDRKGEVIWTHRLSQGGPLGGVEFGPAADADTFYVGIADIFTPAKPARGLFAFRIADGEQLWSTPSPEVECAWKNPFCAGSLSQAVSAMPGAVFAGAMDGHFRAYDAKTGKIVWDFDTARPVKSVSGREAKGGVMDGAGPTIAGGMVYVNSGYQGRSGTPGIVLMAFSVDGR